MMETKIIEEQQEVRSGRSSYRSGRMSPRLTGALGGLSGLALRTSNSNRHNETTSDYRSNDRRESRHEKERNYDPHSYRSREGSISSCNSRTKEERQDLMSQYSRVSQQSRDNNVKE